MNRLFSFLLFTSFQALSALPSVTPIGGNGAGATPTELISDGFKWLLLCLGLLLVSLLFLTVIKNGLKKYHQLGEQKNTATWRDLFVNVIFGTALAVFGVCMIAFAINII